METAVSVGVWKEIETRTHQWEREGKVSDGGAISPSAFIDDFTVC